MYVGLVDGYPFSSFDYRKFGNTRSMGILLIGGIIAYIADRQLLNRWYIT